MRFLLVTLLAGAAAAGAPVFPVNSNLRAGVARVDITPPLGTPMAGYAARPGGATGSRDPLYASALVFDDGQTRAALIALDLVGTRYPETKAIRAAVSKSAGVPEEHILVASSHTHAGPVFSIETDYGRVLVAQIAGAAATAAGQLRPVSLGYGEDAITFNVSRRLPGPDGKVLFKVNPAGPVDRRVKVLRLDDGASIAPMAVLMYAVCHPNVLRAENTRWSADFPGVARTVLEQMYGGRTTSLFIQGCSGDVRANLPGSGAQVEDFRSGDEADLQWAGIDLGAAAARATARLAVREELGRRASRYAIRCATGAVDLPARADLLQHDRWKEIATKDGRRVHCDLQALRIGDMLFLAMPGEPMVNYGFQIEKAIGPRANVFVTGYANGSIGYIVTAESFQGMGYEPESSPLSAAAEKPLLEAMTALAARVF
ncbi:MAG: neutral/alkaline non-lysosomal ceramidase N-terminal domain-containing protein [Bryobacteraceae bacterium]|nr:neutral/alkaline non-lysosomal ceramidase N-terminal domain-containing protein [Bryobacteraceae bacterium]